MTTNAEGKLIIHRNEVKVWASLLSAVMMLAGGGGGHYLERTFSPSVSREEHQHLVDTVDKDSGRLDKLESKFDIIEDQHNRMENELSRIDEKLKHIDEKMEKRR